ncbi:MAG: hypothetical protein ACK5Y8_11355 [Betaproteobacteria bacterium]
MDRADAERLWAEVRALLRAPAPADDPELRRAARLLASSRSDALELLLARWLAAQRGGAFAQPEQAAPPPDAAARSSATAPARSGFGPREALLVTGGLVGGAFVADLLDDSEGLLP